VMSISMRVVLLVSARCYCWGSHFTHKAVSISHARRDLGGQFSDTRLREFRGLLRTIYPQLYQILMRRPDSRIFSISTTVVNRQNNISVQTRQLPLVSGRRLRVAHMWLLSRLQQEVGAGNPGVSGLPISILIAYQDARPILFLQLCQPPKS
jgi:hypothetical protein